MAPYAPHTLFVYVHGYRRVGLVFGSPKPVEHDLRQRRSRRIHINSLRGLRGLSGLRWVSHKKALTNNKAEHIYLGRAKEQTQEGVQI